MRLSTHNCDLQENDTYLGLLEARAYQCRYVPRTQPNRISLHRNQRGGAGGCGLVLAQEGVRSIIVLIGWQRHAEEVRSGLTSVPGVSLLDAIRPERDPPKPVPAYAAARHRRRRNRRLRQRPVGPVPGVRMLTPRSFVLTVGGCSC